MMDWKNFRVNQRLDALKTAEIEQIYRLIAEIDAVKKSWFLTKRLSAKTIEQLTHSVIVTSTGASNRIEGNQLTDQQVEDLYKNLNVQKLKTRDQQEVAGYLQTLEFIFKHYKTIPIQESSILQIHHTILKYSHKDSAQAGKYKITNNRVEARDDKGNLIGVIFELTPPFLVHKEMHELIDWFHWAVENTIKHPLILIANFIFEFLAIHPFQDGNGRTSRLLSNVMLLHNDYQFTKLVSHEKIIEDHKIDYYRALNKSQKSWKTDQEDITPWILFFLMVVKTQAMQALEIIESADTENVLSPKQLALWQWIVQSKLAEFSRKDAVEALGFPERTIESSIKKLLTMKKLVRLGQGKATRYKLIK